MTRDEFLYQTARYVSYPTWVSAFVLGILLAAGVITGAGWLIAILVLLGIAMPIGVKLSRMELTNAMVAVFQTGIKIEREREAREALDAELGEDVTQRIVADVREQLLIELASRKSER